MCFVAIMVLRLLLHYKIDVLSWNLGNVVAGEKSFAEVLKFHYSKNLRIMEMF